MWGNNFLSHKTLQFVMFTNVSCLFLINTYVRALPPPVDEWKGLFCEVTCMGIHSEIKLLCSAFKGKQILRLPFEEPDIEFWMSTKLRRVQETDKEIKLIKAALTKI